MYKAILLDDEYMILAGLDRLINWEALGIECVAKLSDGQEGLDYVREHPVDIVITDVSMPRMTGIEFVKQAQEEGINFNFIILSGYQEFEYVRQGINLGAENFLLKPINAGELNDTLEKTVEKLNAEKLHVESDELLFETTMNRWISDDIDVVDLRRVMKGLDNKLETNSRYSCIIIGYIKEERKEHYKHSMENLGLKYYFFKDDLLIVIIEGEMKNFELVRKALVFSVIADEELIGLGELFVQIDQVYKSYDQAESLIDVAKFYGNSPISKQSELRKEIEKPSEFHAVSFEKFHYSLSIRDKKLIHREIENLLQETIKLKAEPEYVRYISFIIFSDIYRQHDNYEDEEYHNYLQTLNQSESIQEIEDLLKKALESNQAQAKIINYNENVQKTLFKIYEEFSEDINITSIAEELHVNAMYLGQIFKKETGKSFSQFLNKFRIEEAQKLLLKSNYNINQIADKVGYSSSGYFYKNFKKECGISPKEYRERYNV